MRTLKIAIWFLIIFYAGTFIYQQFHNPEIKQERKVEVSTQAITSAKPTISPLPRISEQGEA